jgi:hypothetical protein
MRVATCSSADEAPAFAEGLEGSDDAGEREALGFFGELETARRTPR